MLSARPFQALWNDIPPAGPRFDPGGKPSLLRYAIAPGAPLATAVRLRMDGSIRLGRWRRFRAEEVIHLRRGFVWRARVGWTISGFDRVVDGAGVQRWALFGLLPVLRASGADVTRSAIGRWLLESVWLPTMLLPENGAAWQGTSVALSRSGESGTLELDLEEDGRPRSLRMPRWGDPEGGAAFAYHPFGGVVEEHRTFSGYTIPSRLRVGWGFGTDRWSEGEFFRATIDDAEFR